MLFILLFLSIFFVFIPTIIYPPVHKMLRDNVAYISLIIFAIILAIISGLLFNSSLTETEKINSLISLSPITFLILYRQFDKISIEKHNRHIYFTMRYGNYWSDQESAEATWSEWYLQMSLFFIPLFWAGIGILMFNID